MIGASHAHSFIASDREQRAQAREKSLSILLTREDAFLRMLDRHLPSAFQNRMPKLLKIEKDNHGLVRSMQISWLRLGGSC